MELDFAQISGGLASLWEGILSVHWPTAFFTDALGLSEAAAKRIPAWLLGYFVLYLVAAVSALTLHFFGRQKSLSRWGDKLVDLILTVLAIPGVRAIGLTLGAARTRADAVEGHFSLSLEGVSWLGQMAAALFIPVGIILVILAMLLIPLHTAVRYGKGYGVAGIPWMIYDVGFGLFCVSALGLGMAYGDGKWYLAIPAAAVLNVLGQTGGVAAHSRPGGRGSRR